MAQDRILGQISLAESATVQSGNLQAMLDTFSSPDNAQWKYDGGILRLGRGDFNGRLVMSIPNVVVEGEGQGTVLHGSVSMQAGGCVLRRCVVRAEGLPYGVKIFRPATLPGTGVPRCFLDDVFIGATSQGAGNGPTVGLWLDGAILTTINKSNFSFCTGSGVYIDSSTVNGSTNVNTFNDCTMNGNGRYGIEAITGPDGISGMTGNSFNHGNIESNTLGAVLGHGHSGITFKGVDFENTVSVSTLFDLAASSCVAIEDCNFVTAVDTVNQAVVLSSCTGIKFVNNRMTDFRAGRVVVFDENCSQLVEYGNKFFGVVGQYLSNRGAL